jgi:hypothetical protein
MLGEQQDVISWESTIARQIKKGRKEERKKKEENLFNQ